MTVMIPADEPVVLVVMGVSGCGKSTIAALLAGQLGWPFEEGDLLHPQSNIDKMAAGEPLTDEDRAPWLNKVADWIESRLDARQNAIVTCSALKRAYRDTINRNGKGVVFVYLSGTYELIASHLAARQGHFMPTSLLRSQFDALEEPAPDEPAVTIDIGPAPSVVAGNIIDALDLQVRVDDPRPRPRHMATARTTEDDDTAR